MKKNIGLTSIFCISSGAMISSGLFVLPGLAFAKVGPAVFVSYFIAGGIALTTVLSLSELITAMPKAGGDYFYVSRSFGQLFGTVSGLLSWLALSLKSAFAIIGIAELIYMTLHINLALSALVLTALFTLLNLVGVKEAVRFQVALVIALIVILLGFTVTGFQNILIPRFDPFLPKGLNAVFSTAGFVFVSFGGVLTTASIAGEIKNPSRNIPMGLIGSVVVVTILYSVVTFVAVGIVSPEQLEGTLAPIALAGKASGGTVLYMAIMVASLLAFITTANGGILTASRYPVALSSDGMLPEMFSKESKKRGSPYFAVIATGILIGLSVLLDLDLLVKAASTVILLSNIFAHLSVIVMRESSIVTYRPTYRAPFYPWLQILGILAFILLIIDMGMEPILLSLGFTTAGVLLYFIRRGYGDAISPALMHLLQRITNKELVTEEGLQKELRTIVEDRDGIIRDEFDQAVERSCYVALAEQSTLEQLWKAIAEKIETCENIDISSEQIIELLRKREADSSTAISPFVAIPHVILEGEGRFNIVMVRAAEGIDFNAKHPSVKAVFALMGSKDMRNLHLRALAAIAQVVQQNNFEKQWLAAQDHRELKDLFLLSKRRRN